MDLQICNLKLKGKFFIRKKAVEQDEASESVLLPGLKKEALQESCQINPKLSGYIFRQLVSLYIKKENDDTDGPSC